MQRLKNIIALGAPGLVLIAALGIGIAWFANSIPDERNISPVPKPVDYSPVLAVSPWKRPADPAELHGLILAPAWTPWVKSPAGVRALALSLPPLGGPARSEPERIKMISERIAGDEAARAIAELTAMVDDNPLAASGPFRSTWSLQLMANKQYAAVARICAALLVPLAYDTAAVEQLLSIRVRALLADQQPQAALAAARQHFCVASMYGSAQALGQLELALAANYPGEPQRIAGLKSAQGFVPATRPATTHAATTAPTTAATQPTPFVLAELPRADDEPRLRAAAEAIHGEDLSSLMARGNLYLMCGDAAAAQRIFTRAVAAATDLQRPAVADALARCEKTRSGSILDANRFVEKVRN